jgi:hypothetical protein
MYIKNLEVDSPALAALIMQSEVKRFRAAYSTSLSERQKLIEENRALREELAAYKSLAGIPSDDVIMTQPTYPLPPPQPIQQFSNPLMMSPPQPTTDVSVKTSPKGIGRIFKRKSSNSVRISPPLQTLNQFDQLVITGNSNIQSTYSQSPSVGGASVGGTPPRTGHARTESNVTMSSLQSQGMEQPLAGVALQFITRLEGVCAEHLHAASACDSDPESAPHGHALMASYLNFPSPYAISSSPSTMSSAPDSSNGSPAPGQMDQRTLEILLNLNFQTNNGEYINTMGGPIYGQISVLDAWNLVSSHTKFGKFDLDAVAHVLSPKVLCRGYGPVIEAEDVFNAIEDVSSGQFYGRI